MTLLYGHPPKIIWIKIGNMSTLKIAAIFNKIYSDLHSFSEDVDHGCFEITSV